MANFVHRPNSTWDTTATGSWSNPLPARTQAPAQSPEVTDVSGVIPAPDAWYDPSDLSTITAVGNGTSQHNDKSGNGLHLLQATSTRRPLTGTRSQNGLNVLDYDGVNDYLASSGAVNIPQPTTIFVVCRTDILSGNHVAVDHATTGYNQVALAPPTGTLWSTWAGTTIVGSAPTGAPQVICVQYNTAGSPKSRLRVDGTETTGDSGADTGNGWELGAEQPNGTTGFWDGWIGEVVIYHRALSVAEITTVETYLRTKWLRTGAPVALTAAAPVSTSAKATLTVVGGGVARALDGKAATSFSAKATSVNRNRGVTAKAATATSAKATLLRRARPLTAKAATSTSAKATTVARAARLTAKAATALSAKGTRVARAARLTAKAATALSLKATLRQTRPLTVKVATSTSAKGTRVARAARLTAKAATALSAKATLRQTRRLTAKAATATSAKATLTVTGVHGVALQGKAATSFSAKATRVNRTARLTAKAATATSATGLRINRRRSVSARSATSTSARASLTVTGVRIVTLSGKAATALNARASRINRAERLTVRVPTSLHAKALLTVRLTVGGDIFVWTGTQWASHPVNVWTGSAWVEKPLMVYDGSAWVPA